MALPPKLTFEQWRAWWGEERLTKRREEKIARGVWLWNRRAENLSEAPCWELRPGFEWTEDWSAMEVKWKSVGGRCFEGGRIIASKWDDAWGRFAVCFPTGYGDPYPPYSPESCATWWDIDADEAIVLGVITEEEWSAHAPPRDPQEGASMRAAFEALSPAEKAELMKELNDLLGGSTRQERYETRKKILPE